MIVGLLEAGIAPVGSRLECEAGRFRSDLYWRLNVMPLELRPLTERRNDVAAIAAALLLRQHRQMTELGSLDPFPWPTVPAMDKLIAHSWPGNARELGNVLQRAMVLREGDRIDACDLHIAGARPVLREASRCGWPT